MPPRFPNSAGFTLTEAMVSTAIGTIIMAGVLTSYILCARYFHAISNYWDIHSDGRYAIERFAADMRAVSDVTTFSTNGPLVVTVPVNFAANGTVLSNKTVTYTFAGGALRRTDTGTGDSNLIATNIYSLTFRLYDRVGSNTTVVATAKAIQLELFLRKYVAGRAQTEDYLSARLDMRNKP